MRRLSAALIRWKSTQKETSRLLPTTHPMLSRFDDDPNDDDGDDDDDDDDDPNDDDDDDQ